MRFHVPGKDAANNDGKQGRMQRLKRFLSSERTLKDYTGKPVTVADYEKEKNKQLEQHFLRTKEAEKEEKKTGRSSFRVNAFTPKEKFHKKPLTEKAVKQLVAEHVQRQQGKEQELQKKFGAKRDRIDPNDTGLKSTVKRKLKNPFHVKSLPGQGHYSEEDFKRDRRENDIKHGLIDPPETPPNIKKRTVQSFKKHFSVKPYQGRDKLVYNENDYHEDSKKTLDKVQQYTEKIRKEKEKRKHYRPTSTTFEGIKEKNDKLNKKREELRKQGLEPSEHKRKRIVNLDVPSYLKKEQEHQKRYQRFWRLKKENDKRHQEQRKKTELARQQERRDGTYVVTYRPSSSDEPSRRRVSTSYVPIENVKYNAHKKTGSTSYVPIEDVKYKAHQRSGNAGYIPIEGSNKSGTNTSYIPIEKVTYGAHNRGTSASYVSVEQIQDWRPGPPSLKIKLMRWGKRGAKYAVAAGFTTFQYIRNKIFDDADDDPTTDTMAKSTAKMQLEKDFYQELLVSDVHNSKGPWKLPREKWLEAKWATMAGKTYAIRGRTFTIDGVLKHDFGYVRNVNIYRTFTVGGRTFTFNRHYKIGGKYSLLRGIKLGSRLGKFGYYAGHTIKNRLTDMLEGDGLSDTTIGSISYVNNRYLLAKEYYHNAKTAYRATKAGARTAYRGASWAARTTARYTSAAYHRVAVPLIRGGVYSARLLITKVAALAKVILAKLLALVSSKFLVGVVAVVLLLGVMITVSGTFAVLITSFFMADEHTVTDYRDMVADLDEGLRIQINQYRNLPFDHIYIHYMNGDGINTNWQEILALVSVYRRQEIDFSEEEQELINEIYDKLNYIQTETSSHTHTRDDGSTYTHSVLDVYVYTLPVSDILGQYLLEQWEIDWYNRLLANANAQYPLVNTE